MALDILVTTNRISQDPVARDFIEHIRNNAARLELDNAALYYDFPTYADYETVGHKPDALLVSPTHGILALKFLQGAELALKDDHLISEADESLGQFCSILIGRLLKSKILRKGLSSLKFAVVPIIYTSSAKPVTSTIELESCQIIASFSGFDEVLTSLKEKPLGADEIAEIRSVVEGAKALTRPQKRHIENPAIATPALALSKLESEIANFDQQQRRAALVNVPGPQRIRGLAGSGKTVILAMKAAHLHLTRPAEKILVTFYTRSLRSSLKSLITKFFRNYRDEDPDWDLIQIRHGWGGTNTAGVYSDACRREGIVPLTFGAARQASIGKTDPFDFACRELIRRCTPKFYYDHILIDEGQDFPTGFYELCYNLAKGDGDTKSIVWAYDELQNILDIKIRSPEELFGSDDQGQPRISLERAGRLLPVGTTNDTVLSKCYRNQREVLVTAHALGFGIYGETIVQMLESREHWQDVGYESTTTNEFKIGDQITVVRPPENSPISVNQSGKFSIIESYIASSVSDETEWVASGVQEFLDGGLQPEDVIVICLDDRNARTYLKRLSTYLAEKGISSNNIIADPYDEPPFLIPGKVTLSTVYRAKGNEASVVYALGVDAISTRSRSGRNKLFTAFTRTKAWLRVSGLNGQASKISDEISTALKHFPSLDFIMPDLKQVDTIQRDLGKRSLKAKKIKDEYNKRLREEGFSDEEIVELLSVEIKMLRADVQSGIYRSWALIEELGLGETFSSPSPLALNEEFRNIILRQDCSYVDVYMAGLRLSHYNFLISDYSYFQFGWEREGYVRFAFYPNPYVAGRSEESLERFKRHRDLLASGLITQEEYLSILRDAQAEIRIPLIRYENAPDQRKCLSHPCSHLHIGFHSENRWPLNRILTPFAFSLNIMKQYYGEHWSIMGRDDAAPGSCRFEQTLIDEKQNCRIVPEGLFDLIEARSFYFG